VPIRPADFVPVLALTVAGSAFAFFARDLLARQPAAAASRIAFDRPLPPMDGQHLVMKVVDVRMPPGATGTPHTHGCAVVVFVVDGAVRMSVRGGRDSVYHRGETFHEQPTDIHQVSANASTTDSAHFTATFVCDHQGPLSTPVPPSGPR
jgi:quercetin dioxygenase-like cupin family protein